MQKHKRKIIKNNRRKKSSSRTPFILISVGLVLLVVFLLGQFLFQSLFPSKNYYSVPSSKLLNGGILKENVSQQSSGTKTSFFGSLIFNSKTVLPKKTDTQSRSDGNDIGAKEDIASDQIVWHGPRDKKEIALTFDADMTPVMVEYLQSGQVKTYNDQRITEYLVKNRIKATFFLTGIWIETYPEVTRQLAQNPLFELENHSYSHPSMAGYCFDQPQIPQSQYPSEIEKVQTLLLQVAHVTGKYFRFPGGCYNQEDLDLVKKEGLLTVHWDDVANDGFNTDTQQIIHNVLSEAQNGSIIVMHLGGETNAPKTADALPVIIAGLKKKGFQFVTVSELLTAEKTTRISSSHKESN